MLWWMEVQWEEWMSEWDSVGLLVNVQSERMVAEKAVAVIQQRWYAVSVGFPSFSVFGIDFSSQESNRSQALMMPERLLAPFTNKGKLVKLSCW